MSAPVPIKDVAEALAKPVGDLLNKFCGVAFEQFGLAWGDSVAMWRMKRLLRLLQEADNRCAEAGFVHRSVSVPLLHGIIERGSLESDDEMQDLWANLLSNAADPREDSNVLPAFPEILKQLTKTEVRFLDELFHASNDPNRFAVAPTKIHPVHFENLKRLGLVTTEFEARMQSAAMLDARVLQVALGNSPEEKCLLTNWGFAFVKACTKPEKGSRDPEKIQPRKSAP